MNTTVKSVTNCFSIIDGPSKSVLFDACLYSYSKDTKIAVNFTIPQGYSNDSNDATRLYIPLPVTNIKITGIEHEDGSGESFILKGYCNVDKDYLLRKENTYRYRYSRFSAYYDARSRKGTFTLITD